MGATSSLPVIYEGRCKICNLAKTHPDLFKDLHYQVLEVGSSHNRAMNYINNIIITNNINTVKLNNQNMAAHFSSHIMLPDRVNSEITKALSPGQIPLRDVSDDMATYIENLVRRKVGNEVNDYLNLDHLRTQLMEKLEFLDEFVTNVDENGKKAIDLEALTHYTTIIKEIRGCILDLNKIRQSKQLLNLVIKSLVEKNTFEIVHRVSREYDQVKQDMLDAGVPPDVVMRIDQNMRLKLAEIVATTARSAIEEVTRMYRLG